MISRIKLAGWGIGRIEVNIIADGEKMTEEILKKIDPYPDVSTLDLMSPEEYEAYDDLLANGMFRNRDYTGLAISGSNADFIYDDEEYRAYAEIIGCKHLEVLSRS